MSAAYNGHKSKAAWNVALWLGNDEGLYNMARDYKRQARGNSERAAEAMLDALHDAGVTKTPDGFAYSKTTLRLAIAGL